MAIKSFGGGAVGELSVGGSSLAYIAFLQMELDTCVMSFRRIDNKQRHTYKLSAAY